VSDFQKESIWTLFHFVEDQKYFQFFVNIVKASDCIHGNQECTSWGRSDRILVKVAPKAQVDLMTRTKV